MHRLLTLLFCASPLLVAADAFVWKVAPPPPASWEADRVADLTAHRRAVMEKVGDKGILILYAAEPRNYAADVDWPYRQENNFYYLTGISEAGSALVLIPGADKVREILFMPPSNPACETWTGHLLVPAEARRISGIQDIWDARLLKPFLSTLIPASKTLLPPDPPQCRAGQGQSPAPKDPPVDVNTEFRNTLEAVSKGDAHIFVMNPRRPSPEYRREAEFATKLHDAGAKMDDASTIFATLRQIKSKRELDALKHAVEITAEAFQRAYTTAVPGTWEYEIQAQFEFTFLRRNAHWGYPCIVASGKNATTLHYESNRDQMKPGDLLLMDDAAEFGGYSVDVTRTIPVSGKYSSEQSDIYRLVYDAQQAGIKMALPGHTQSRGKDSIQGAATEVLKKGLAQLGLITDPESDKQARIWFIHGMGHGIGLNVHDPDGAELHPGMVVTVEPGIYIRPDALDNLPKTPENELFIAAVRPAFEKYKGIGIRIEDDVMITDATPQVLSAAIPSKLEEVEASIARLREAKKTAPLP